MATIIPDPTGDLNDFVFQPDEDSLNTWVTAGKFSIDIRYVEGDLRIDVYKKGDELSPAFASIHLDELGIDGMEN